MIKQGFTLIEIIIVIVILGVLATLALPRLAAQVDASEGAEAMQFFGAIKRAAVNCYDASGSFAACRTSVELAVGVPVGSKFAFFHSGPTTADTSSTWWARSTRNTANYILMNIDNTTKTSMATNIGSPYGGIVNKINSSTAIAVPITANSF